MSSSSRGHGGICAYLFTLLTLLAIFPNLIAAAGTGVIGLDLGSEYLKAVLVQPGIPLEIVPTKDSKRKEAASVAFKPSREHDAVFPERFYGGDALALAPRFPDDVYSNLKTLLGVPFETGVQGPDAHEGNIVEMYMARYPAVKLEEIAGRGTVGLRSDRVGKPDGGLPFMVEELLAMQLKQIKLNAERLGGDDASINDAVITFPSFYTAEEKRSVLLAADLAGLNVLSVISDGLAVGLNYATSRTFPSVTDGQAPEYHVVYDIGAGSTTASILRLQSQKVKDVGRFNKTVQEVYVDGTGYDKTLGGDALNKLIVDDMVNKLIESKKLPSGVTEEKVRSHGRTMAKFWKESERLRQVLSANADSTTSFETLVNEDVNFKYTISRAHFEELAQGHAERVAKPLNDALAAAGLTMDQINSIILHGGASRTPFVQKALETACGDASKLRTNVNADEAAVFGAAFKGAELSPAFRVKEIRTYDTPSFTVGMKWVSGDKQRQQKLFTPSSTIGLEKQITMKNLEDFEFSFYQQYEQGGKVVEAPVDSVVTKNLTASVAALKDKFGCEASNITTKFTVRLSPVDGLPEVVSGTVSCEVAEKKGVMDDVKGFFGLGKKDKQAPLNAEEAIDVEQATESSSTSTSEPATSSTTSTTPAKPSASASPSTKTRTEIIPIELTTLTLRPVPLAPTDLDRIKTRLTHFDASDLARIHREEIFNTLESSIYRSRDLLSDPDFARFITAEDLATLDARVQEASEWIENEGANAGVAALQGKLEGLRGLVNPALKRKGEAKGREESVERLQGTLSSAKSMVKMIENQVEAAEAMAAAYASSSAEAGAGSETGSPAASASSTVSFGDGEETEEGESTSPSSSSTRTSSTTTPPARQTPSAPWSKSDLETLNSLYTSTNTWLEKALSEQEQRADSQDPAFTVSELRVQEMALQKELQRILYKASAGSGSGGGYGGYPGGEGGGSGGKGKKARKGKGKSSSGAGEKQGKTSQAGQEKEGEKAGKAARDEL